MPSLSEKRASGYHQSLQIDNKPEIDNINLNTDELEE
jgi:hypothetical protein